MLRIGGRRCRGTQGAATLGRSTTVLGLVYDLWLDGVEHAGLQRLADALGQQVEGGRHLAIYITRIRLPVDRVYLMIVKLLERIIQTLLFQL